MTTPDLILTGTTCEPVSLPLNPFVSNRYHFGMLLGVADLDTDQGYHRGKAWLHNAWLHGEGAVWGLGVQLRPAAGELVVNPGLALDRNGRELRVLDPLCLDLGRWYDERRPDDLDVTEDADGVHFQVHVTLCSEQCLDRPVPASGEDCEGSNHDTAYSRAVEQAVPDLSPGRAPELPLAPYRRLRELVGQLPAEDADVVAALAEIGQAAAADRAAVCLAWFRRLAALDTIDLGPDGGPGELLPAADNGCITLADLAVHLRRQGGGWIVVADGERPTTVDPTVRPTHVRTRTIQELLCGSAGSTPEARPPLAAPRGGAAPATAAPPSPLQVIAASAELSGSSLRLSFTQPLLPATVSPRAFTVTALRPSGWVVVQVSAAELDDSGRTVTLSLRSAPRVRPVRVVVQGAGATPLLGDDGSSLAGTDGDPRTGSGGADGAVTIAGTAPPEDADRRPLSTPDEEPR